MGAQGEAQTDSESERGEASWPRYPPDGWKNVNRRRRRRPVSVLLSHHRCLATSSRVIVDPSSCCVTRMTTNNQSVIVHRLVAMLRCDMAPGLLVCCDYHDTVNTL